METSFFNELKGLCDELAAKEDARVILDQGFLTSGIPGEPGVTTLAVTMVFKWGVAPQTVNRLQILIHHVLLRKVPGAACTITACLEN